MITTATKKELSAYNEILLVGIMTASNRNITATAPNIPLSAIFLVFPVRSLMNALRVSAAAYQIAARQFAAAIRAPQALADRA